MYTGAVQKVLRSDGASNVIAVNAETTVYTRAFPLHKATYFGVHALFTSATGTPNIKVELEESWTLPTTEGSAETTSYVEPDGFSDIFSAINDEVAHIATITPVPMAYGRYKITGLTGNPADCVGTIYNFLQEQV